MSSKFFFPVIILVVAATFVYAKSQEELDYKPGELIIRFKKDKQKPKTIKEKQALVNKKGGGKIKGSLK